MTHLELVLAVAVAPAAIVLVECRRCKLLRLPGSEVLCRACLREVSTLFSDDDETTAAVAHPYFLLNPNQEGRNPAPISGA